MMQQTITQDEAMVIGDAIGMNWQKVDIQEFKRGLEVELEHGLVNKNSNVTNDDIYLTGKIAMAHLNELNDYYTRLDIVENTKFKVAQENDINIPTNNSLSILAGAAVGVGLFAFIKYLTNKKDKNKNP